MAENPPALDEVSPEPAEQAEVRPVRIVDIDIPLASLVVFILKLVLVAIPALLLIALIAGALYLVIVAIWMLATNPFA